MKQWQKDKADPEAAKEREKKSQSKKQRISKKVKLSAMAQFHSIPLDRLVK